VGVDFGKCRVGIEINTAGVTGENHRPQQFIRLVTGARGVVWLNLMRDARGWVVSAGTGSGPVDAARSVLV
jgi:hypothetical protein